MTLSLSTALVSACTAGHNAQVGLRHLADTYQDLAREAMSDAATVTGALSIVGETVEVPAGISPQLAAALEALNRDIGFARADLAAHVHALGRLADRAEEDADTVRLLASRLPVASVPQATPSVNGTVELIDGEPAQPFPCEADEIVAPVFSEATVVAEQTWAEEAAAQTEEPGTPEQEAAARADLDEAIEQYHDARAQFAAELASGEDAQPNGLVEAVVAVVAALPPAQEAPPPPLAADYRFPEAADLDRLEAARDAAEAELRVEQPGKKRPTRKPRAKK